MKIKAGTLEAKEKISSNPEQSSFDVFGNELYGAIPSITPHAKGSDNWTKINQVWISKYLKIRE